MITDCCFTTFLGEKYSVFPTGEFHIRDAIESDDHSLTGYRCKIRNLVSNETRLSSQGSIIVSGLSSLLHSLFLSTESRFSLTILLFV
jgi:hypothetical protein